MSDQTDDDGTGVWTEIDPDLLAAEYVLGTLTVAEAAAVRQRAATDSAMVRAVAAWEARLAPLADCVPALPAPQMVWRRLALAAGIERDLPSTASPLGRAWRSVGLWRGVAVGGFAIAASLALLLVQPGVAGPEPLLAALTAANGPGATFLVRVAADGSATILALGGVTVPAGRSLELWARDEGGPVSLGLLPAAGRARLQLQVRQGTQLLVTEEAEGGSPTKQPTSAPIFAGVLNGV